MLLHYSLHEPRRGRADIEAFMTEFRKAFPDLYFWGAADLTAEGDYVLGRWEGGGTHTGPGLAAGHHQFRNRGTAAQVRVPDVLRCPGVNGVLTSTRASVEIGFALPAPKAVDLVFLLTVVTAGEVAATARA